MIGTQFLGWTSTRDLHEKQCAVSWTPNLIDHAKNAMNSSVLQGHPSRLPVLSLRDFQYSQVSSDGKTHHFCSSEKLLPAGLDYTTAGNCVVCDDVAVSLDGTRIWRDGKEMCWGFPDESTALRHFLLCLFLTTGSSRFYTHSIHNGSRRKYNKFIANVTEYEQAWRNKNVLEGSNDTDQVRFAVAYKKKNSAEMPFFYVIGNRSLGRNPSEPDILNDFAIALPSKPYWDKHCVKGGRKPTKKDSNGAVVFIRPLFTSKCIHVNQFR